MEDNINWSYDYQIVPANLEYVLARFESKGELPLSAAQIYDQKNRIALDLLGPDASVRRNWWEREFVTSDLISVYSNCVSLIFSEETKDFKELILKAMRNNIGKSVMYISMDYLEKFERCDYFRDELSEFGSDYFDDDVEEDDELPNYAFLTDLFIDEDRFKRSVIATTKYVEASRFNFFGCNQLGVKIPPESNRPYLTFLKIGSTTRESASMISSVDDLTKEMPFIYGNLLK